MSKLRNCLTKSNFSKEDEAKIISLSETYKQQGDSDLVAETKAIHDFHKGLVEDLNKLKSELKLPIQKYETPTVEPKYKSEEKPQENGEQPTKPTKETRPVESEADAGTIIGGIKTKIRGTKEAEVNEGVEETAKLIKANIKTKKAPVTEVSDVLISVIRLKIATYNEMGRRGRKSEDGVNLYKEIQQQVKDIGYGLNTISDGKILLVTDKGKRVVSKPRKRPQTEIDAEKAQKEFERKALNANPISVEHAVVLDIANGVRFDHNEFVRMTKIPKKEIPLGLTQEKGGQKFEFYATHMAETLGLLGELDVDARAISEQAAEVAEHYATSDYKARAKERAVEIYERIQNQGYTNKQLEEMNNQQEEGVAGEDWSKDVESTAKALEGKTKKLELPFFRGSGKAKEDIIETSKYASKKIDEKFDIVLDNSDTFPFYVIKDKNGNKVSDKEFKTKNSANDEALELIGGWDKMKAEMFSEAYHKAKADGSNPELVKAVEDLLGKPSEETEDGVGIITGNQDEEAPFQKKKGINLFRGDVKDLDTSKPSWWTSSKKLATSFAGKTGKVIETKFDTSNSLNTDLVLTNTYTISELSKVIGLTEKEILDAQVNDYTRNRVALGIEKAHFILENKSIQDLLKQKGYNSVSAREIVSGSSAPKAYLVFSNSINNSPFQKKKSESATDHIAEVVKRIQKVLPKVKVVYDENLDAAGQMKGDTILINPYYAGTDTPIHEAAHVLLDAMGENKVVMAAVEQLKGTELWKETKERYPELSEKALANEVLAEAIGREGAGIFKTEAEKSQFKAYLTYIFDWLKRKLGLDKNIAKSLAKQIIGGIGTKELTGISTKNQNVSDEVKYAEREFKKAEDELKASKNAFDAKRKELDKGLIADAEDLFGERKSNADMGLFDERASVSARNEAVAPLKARYEKAQEDYKKAKEKLDQARSKPGSQQSLFQKKKYGKAFTQFREEKLGRDVAQIKKDLAEFKRMLNEDDLSPEEETVVEDIIRGIRQQFEDDKDAYDEFLNQMDNVEEVFNAEDLEGFTLDELIEAYNTARNYDGYADKKMLEAVKQKIAIYMSETRRKELRKNNKFIEENANKTDLRWKDVWFKTLSHMTQDFPELQALNNLFDESFLEMQEERVALKTKAKRLADAVIKEKNKQLGLGQRVGAMFSSDNARYFEYMDDGGKLRTNTAGLSKAQIELLDFVRETTKNKQTLDENGNVIEDDILKIDKTFSENFRESGLMKAIGDYMGGNHADVQVTYVNPLTDKAEKATYADAEKAILEYAKRGVAQKGLALAKLLKLAYKAKANATNSGYSLGNGRLVSKFDRPREQGKGYSKDFYNALVQYIDDYTHVKHMNKFVPIVDSLEMLAQRGYEEQLAKPNVVKWLKEWKEEQLYRKPKETDPIIDAALKTLRTLTSQIVMGFNIGAAGMNIFVGNYNNWRKDAANLGWFGFKSGLVGNKRFASKKGIALLKKYDVVKTDVDSYPTFKIGRAFQDLAHAAQSYGEMQIQGSMFLSQLTEAEWNSFEMKDGELVLKDTADKKEINKKFAQYKNKVSDVQGKYSEKDRRNFMRGELGKIASQFKVWMPDAWKERFGKEYINSHGETVRGTYRILMADSLAELRKQVMTKQFWTSKEMKSNLKGAMLIAAILVARYQDDDDEKKRRKALSLDNALGNLLFVFDTDQLKYLAKSPVAALGTVTKFLDSFQDAVNMDVDKFEKDAQKVVPYGKLYSDVKDLATEE